MTEPDFVDMSAVERWVAEIAGGERSELDLSRLKHDGAAHNQLTPLAVLAWWLLACEHPDGLRVKVPSGAALRLLGRSGLPFAAERRGVELVRNGRVTSASALLSRRTTGQDRLPNIDWHVFDDPTSSGTDRLRVIPDLEDQRRAPPQATDGRRYHWVDGLGAATALRQDRRRFDGDADQVLYEAISNVHRWSAASRAVAACSVTTGGAKGADGAALSWNRLHVVVFDDGVGIPAGVRRKRVGERNAPDWTPEVRSVMDRESLRLDCPEDAATALVLLLVERAFGSRPIDSTKDGHGLHSTGVAAGRWVGRLEVFTAADEAHAGVARVSETRSVVSGQPRLTLPGSKGTLIHVTLNAVAPQSKERDTAETAEPCELTPTSL